MKEEPSTMMLSELLTLFDEGKLVEYDGRIKSVWTDTEKANYLSKLVKSASSIGDTIVFYISPNSSYVVIDGRQRVQLIIDFMKSTTWDDLKDNDWFEKNKYVYICTQLLSDVPDDILCHIDHEVSHSITESEIRQYVVCPEKKQLVDRLLKHRVFAGSHFVDPFVFPGSKNPYCLRDYAEILLAFCCCKEFKGADKATLPSGLLNFVKENLSPEEGEDACYFAEKTMDLLYYLLADEQYILRAKDFCYMAIFYSCILKANHDEFKIDYRRFGIELSFRYLRIEKELEPCITLSPLADENIIRLRAYFDDIISDIIDSGREGDDY